MMSFWNRRKKKEIDVNVIEVTLAGLARQIVHDGILGDPQEISRMLELPPLSEDVLEMEEEASHMRLHRVDEYVPLLEMHALVMGQVCMASYKLSNPEKELDEESESEMQTLFRLVCFSSSLTALSLLLDLGLVIAEGELE